MLHWLLVYSLFTILLTGLGELSSKMIFLYLKLAILVVPGYQTGEKNCLRKNPGALDGDFSLANRYEDHDNFDEEDIAKHVTLFTTRFKRGHMFFVRNKEWMKVIGDGVSYYNRLNNKKFDFFVGLLPSGKETNVTAGIQVFEEHYQTIKNINSGSDGPIKGLYVGLHMVSYIEQLEVLTSVFGPKENSTFPIGAFLFHHCLYLLKFKHTIKYLQRLEFLTCDLIPKLKSSAEESADEVLKDCQKIQDIVTSLNITAEFMSRTRYPTFGTTENGVIGSVSDFQSFWCRIVEQITHNMKLPRIIMQSPFNDTPEDYKVNVTELNDSDYHFGWWRRRETTSYEATAFEEKVDELEEGKEHGKCTGICSECNSDSECCEKTFCEFDNSFQPFETGPKPRVCKTLLLTCAPRPPKKSAPSTTSSTDTRTTSTPIQVTLPLSAFSSSSLPPSIVPGLTDESHTSISLPVAGGSILSAVNVSIFVLLVLLLVASGIAFYFYRGGKSNKVLTQQEVNQFFDGCYSPGDLKGGKADAQGVVENLPYDKQLEISTNDFKIQEDQFLGSGEFGVIFKGFLRNEVVAVKTTFPGVDKIYFKSLLLELKVLMYLGQHENIVNLLGAHTLQLRSGKLYLFLELCSMGNLLELLRSHRHNFLDDTGCDHIQIEGDDFHLTCTHLLQWSEQVASAMEHLANKRVIHADIAARNVLVFSKTHVKLTDFGLSRRLHENSQYVKKSQEPLPWRHMSVEALRDRNFSVQSDIWSFGVTLWEIFSLGSVPYPGHSMSDDFVELILGGLMLSCPKHAHPLIYEIMKSCWELDVKSRPPIGLVRLKLTSALNEIYTKSQYFSRVAIQ